MDAELRKKAVDLIEEIVPPMIAEQLASVSEACTACRRHVQEQLTDQQRGIDRMSLHLEAERDLVKVKLDQIVDQIASLGQKIEGDAKGSLPTRIAVLELEVQSLQGSRERKRSESVAGVQGVVSQLVPYVINWSIIGIIYLIYMVVTHAPGVIGGK